MGPLGARQLLFVGRGGDGDPFDEPGVRPEAAGRTGDAKRPAAEGAGDHMGDLVTEHRVRVAAELQIDLRPPRLGDVRVGRAHEPLLLRGVPKEEGGDSPDESDPERCLVVGELLFAVAHEEPDLVVAEPVGKDDVAAGAGAVAGEGGSDRGRRLPMPEGRPLDVDRHAGHRERGPQREAR